MRLNSLWTYTNDETAPPPEVVKPTNTSSTSRRGAQYTGLGYRYNGFINVGVFLNAFKKSRLSAK